jgi:hypothetical protein
MKKLFKYCLFLISIVFSINVSAFDYTTPYGEWRGQTEYQAFIKTTSDPAAHTITNLTILVNPSGKVTGTSTENNCKLLGLASPGSAPFIVMLNVTVTGCTYAGLNRTYQGLLSVFTKDKYAKFSLQAIDISSGKSGTFNITSTMRR